MTSTHTTPSPPSPDPLLAWLATHDAPCPVCGYNLRALPEPRCPECSAPLALHVWSENAAIGPWLVALVSFSLAAGFDGVVSLLLTTGFAIFPPPPGSWGLSGAIIVAFYTLFLTCGIAIFWLATRRRRFWRLRRRSQWIAAAAAFVSVFLVHASFGGFLIYILD